MIRCLAAVVAALVFPVTASALAAPHAARTAGHHRAGHHRHRTHHRRQPARHRRLTRHHPRRRLARAAARRPRHPAHRHSTPVAFAADFQGVTYYVSPNGSDSNSGTSPAQAWRSVEQVDRADLRPGDAVLFQGGATFADDALMPGWGSGASGSATAPITFGSYGQGRASLPQGVWFKDDSDLTFENLALGPSTGDMSNGGFQGSGDGITIDGLVIQHAEIGIQSNGDDWRITDNTINETGDSGMLLGGDAGEPGDPPGGRDYLISGNTITNTGVNPALTFGTHGIYLKVSQATVRNNTITNFNNDGISIRYRDSTIIGNRISGGEIGLAWFQYDTQPGTSVWRNNTLSRLSTVGIFVCGVREGCRQPLESFGISHNTIQADPGNAMNLQPTAGTYSVGRNQL